jgi:DNA invertase Pin-like site-specific DNA recombinase
VTTWSSLLSTGSDDPFGRSPPLCMNCPLAVYMSGHSGRVDTSTPTGRAVTSIMATIAELELELGKERRAASREAGVARGLAATKPMKLDAAQQKRLLRLYEQGEPVGELTSLFGVSRSTLFRTIKVLRSAKSLSA